MSKWFDTNLIDHVIMRHHRGIKYDTSNAIERAWEKLFDKSQIDRVDKEMNVLFLSDLRIT